jgi:hypothetical protein
VEGIIPAPYLARAKWVALERLDALRDDELRDLLTESYRLVVEKLPAKKRQQLSAGTSAAVKSKVKRAAKSKRAPAAKRKRA